MKFSTFVETNLDAIVQEWEVFARTLLPAANVMSRLALRDHARDMLIAIVRDMETVQTLDARSVKSKQIPLSDGLPESAASAHGALRQMSGFDLSQLVAEFRALRASVLALWHRSDPQDLGSSSIEEIARFNEGIDQALAESVERYSTDIATFLAVIGHDLRSPLRAIQGTCDMLATREVVSEDMRRDANLRISRSSKLMGHLINDLLVYTGALLGRGIPIQPTACDLASVCAQAVDAIKAIHENRDFVTQLAGDLHLTADKLRLRQVVSNLLSNAVYHGDPHAPITLRATGQPDAVLVEVQNLGRVIPPTAWQSIFEPLEQARTAKSEPHQAPYTSLGMGLFIVREIVHLHHGTVSITSDAEAGTVFTCRLPRRFVAD